MNRQWLWLRRKSGLSTNPKADPLAPLVHKVSLDLYWTPSWPWHIIGLWLCEIVRLKVCNNKKKICLHECVCERRRRFSVRNSSEGSNWLEKHLLMPVHLPPRRGVWGMSYWEVVSGQTKTSLEQLYLLTGLGTTQCHSMDELEKVAGVRGFSA